MKQLFETDELIGKTIASAFIDDEPEIILVFKDETFVVFYDEEHEYAYTKPTLAISRDEFDTQPNRDNYKMLYEQGFINQYVHDELHAFFTQMLADEEQKAFLNKRREEIHKLQQLAQKYPEIATLK